MTVNVWIKCLSLPKRSRTRGSQSFQDPSSIFYIILRKTIMAYVKRKVVSANSSYLSGAEWNKQYFWRPNYFTDSNLEDNQSSECPNICSLWICIYSNMNTQIFECWSHSALALWAITMAQNKAWNNFFDYNRHTMPHRRISFIKDLPSK